MRTEAGNTVFTHAVMKFIHEKDSYKNVDLIPMNWVADDELSCSYPKKSQYKYLEKWVKESKTVEKSWLHSQAIIIIKKSSSYEKSFKRLQSYLKTLDCGDTTAIEDLEDNQNRQLKRHTSNILKAIQQANEENGLDDLNIKKSLIKLHSTLKNQLKEVFYSIEYDVLKEMEQFENKMMLNIGLPLGKGLNEDFNKLEVKFPIFSLETFHLFDQSLSRNSEKQLALKTIMRSYGRSKKTVSEMIRAILSQIIEKSVQVKFSGEGKRRSQSNHEAKESFNATYTFQCMRDVIVSLLGNSVSEKEIRQKTGIWFKGAYDRNGGRKTR